MINYGDQGGLKMALTLGRKDGQSIIIADIIKVQVLKTEDGLVRLKIDAPIGVDILREEIYEERTDHGEALQALAEEHRKHIK